MNSSKISTIALWVMIIISLGVLGAFYLGGGEMIDGNDAPFHTETLMYWMYALLGFALVFTVGASLIQFAGKFAHSPKDAIGTLVSIAAFAAVVGLAWVLGDDTPLVIKGYEGTDNVPFWLKITDMNIYASYILTGLAIVFIVLGTIKKRLS